jgi:putative FmdB family regulatory protein
MPIYEYVCNGCGKKFEYLVRGVSDAARCPGCESRDLRKLISGFAFRSQGRESSSCGSCSGGDCSHCSG